MGALASHEVPSCGCEIQGGMYGAYHGLDTH
jgi:hypothetical protein